MYLSFKKKKQKTKKKEHKIQYQIRWKNKNKKSNEILVSWDFKSHVGNLNFGQILKIHVSEKVCGNTCNVV